MTDSTSVAENDQTEPNTAVFAAGHFWTAEAVLRLVPGVRLAESGYAGGRSPAPTFEEVETGQSGHCHAVRLSFKPEWTSFDKLVRVFFEIHDPTQLNRQGDDVGPQYRSAIFYLDENQKAIAEAAIARLKELGWPVLTALEPLVHFHRAEDRHQHYIKNHGHPLRPRIRRFDQAYQE
jgi:methionine-S-sulfoxide reductase